MIICKEKKTGKIFLFADYRGSYLDLNKFTIIKRVDVPKELRLNRRDDIFYIIDKQNKALNKALVEVLKRRKLIEFLKNIESEYQTQKSHK